MALKKTVSKAEFDALPEHFKAEYRPDGDNYTLNVEGGEDPERLKKALEDERKKAREAERQLAQERDRFKDIEDPDAAREALKQKRELEEKKLLQSGDVDKIVEQRTAALRRDYEAKIAAITKERDDAKAELDTTTRVLSEKIIDSEIISAFSEAGGRPEAHEDVRLRASRTFKVVDGKAVAMNGDEVVYGKDGRTPMTPKEWVASLTPTAGHLFHGSGGGGAENKRNGAGGGVGRFAMSREAARTNPQEYQRLKAEAEKVGQTVSFLPE